MDGKIIFISVVISVLWVICLTAVWSGYRSKPRICGAVVEHCRLIEQADFDSCIRWSNLPYTLHLYKGGNCNLTSNLQLVLQGSKPNKVELAYRDHIVAKVLANKRLNGCQL